MRREELRRVHTTRAQHGMVILDTGLALLLQALHSVANIFIVFFFRFAIHGPSKRRQRGRLQLSLSDPNRGVHFTRCFVPHVPRTRKATNFHFEKEQQGTFH